MRARVIRWVGGWWAWFHVLDVAGCVGVAGGLGGLSGLVQQAGVRGVALPWGPCLWWCPVFPGGSSSLGVCRPPQGGEVWFPPAPSERRPARHARLTVRPPWDVTATWQRPQRRTSPETHARQVEPPEPGPNTTQAAPDSNTNHRRTLMGRRQPRPPCTEGATTETQRH